MILSILYKFILKDILLRFIIIKNNTFKYKSYRANLVEKKNNLHYVIKAININELRISSSYYIYTNINKFKLNPYLRLISTIYNFLDNNTIKNYNDNSKLVISYNLYNYRKLLSN